MCHEAYEESLATSGINIKLFFSNPNVAIPIVHASVDFFRPMFCGDEVSIYLSPCQLGNDNFEINYIIMSSGERQINKATTRHVCINPFSRSRQELSNEMMLWLQQWGS